MAYYFLYPQKDSTIYSHPNRKKTNTGGDEILEIVKEKGSSDQRYYPSRILIKFNNEEIKTTISDIVGVNKFNASSSANVFTDCSVNLQLSTTEHKNLARVLNLELFAVSQSWDEGTGRFSSIPSASNGCSWVFRDNDDVTKTKWTTGSFNTVYGSTGSINASGITEGGGVWYTGSNFTATQQFNNADNLDTDFNVTNIIHKFSASLFNSSGHPTGIENNGFIIKQPDIIETNTSESFGELKYFSVDTHTIHPPKLTFKWDDSVHTYQSSAKQSGELNVSLYRNKEEYKTDEEVIFRLNQESPLIMDIYNLARESADKNPIEGLMYLERAQNSGKFGPGDLKKLFEAERSLFAKYKKQIANSSRRYLRNLVLPPLVIVDTNVLFSALIDKIANKLELASETSVDLLNQDNFHKVLFSKADSGKIKLWLPNIVKHELKEISK